MREGVRERERERGCVYVWGESKWVEREEYDGVCVL